MNKEDYIAKYGEAAYAKMQAQRDAWAKAHPEEIAASQKTWADVHPDEVRAQSKAWREAHPEEAKATHAEQSHKGGKHYERYLQYNRTGLRGERNSIRNKHSNKYRQYKRIIDLSGVSQIHHEWIPGTAEYTGVALVEADQHMYGFVDVIEILEGKITLLTEAEVKKGGKRK